MIYSLKFTDESLNDCQEAREWLETVNAQLLDAQKRFLAEFTAFGSASLDLHAGSGHTLRRSRIDQPEQAPVERSESRRVLHRVR